MKLTKTKVALDSYSRVREFFGKNKGEYTINSIRAELNIDYRSIEVIIERLLGEKYIAKIDGGKFVKYKARND